MELVDTLFAEVDFLTAAWEVVDVAFLDDVEDFLTEGWFVELDDFLTALDFWVEVSFLALDELLSTGMFLDEVDDFGLVDVEALTLLDLMDDEGLTLLDLVQDEVLALLDLDVVFEVEADLAEEVIFEVEEELAELWFADVFALLTEEVLSLIDAAEEATLAVEEEILLEADEARTATLDVEEEDLAKVDEDPDAVLKDVPWEPEDTEIAELVPTAAALDDPEPKEPSGPPPILPLGAEPIDWLPLGAEPMDWLPEGAPPAAPLPEGIEPEPVPEPEDPSAASLEATPPSAVRVAAAVTVYSADMLIPTLRYC